MKCAVHPDVDAIGYCRNCGKALCSVCARPIRDVFYCEDCLAGAVGIPPTPSARPLHMPPAPHPTQLVLYLTLHRPANNPVQFRRVHAPPVALQSRSSWDSVQV